MLKNNYKTLLFLVVLTNIMSINAFGVNNLKLKDGKFNTLDYNIYAGKQALDSLSAEIENNKNDNPETILNLVNYYVSSEEKVQRDTEDRQTLHFQLDKNSSKDKEVYSKLSDSLKPPINCKYLPVKHFGVALNKDSLTECTEYNYIELSTPQGTNILSQFSGVVDKVENQDNSYIVSIITSDKKIKCVYSNVLSTDVKEGDEINQYDVIGIQNKYDDNLYLRLEVLLDGKDINPSLLYK